MIFEKQRFEIWSQAQHPLKHTTADFAILDTLVNLQALTNLANGQIVYATDTNEFYYWDGSALASLGGGGGGGGTGLTDHINDTTAAHMASAIGFTPAGTIAATTAQLAIEEVATDAASDLSGHTGATTSVHGIADTSILVTTTGTQQLTNKDIDGGTASNTSRITLPKAGTAALNALTDKEGTIAYDTDKDAIVVNDGTDWIEVAGGGGGATAYTATATSGSWTSSDPFEQVLTVTGLSATSKVILDLDLSAVSFANVVSTQNEFSKIYRAVPGTNSLTLYATNAPTISLNFNITVI